VQAWPWRIWPPPAKNKMVGTFVKKSGSGDMATFAPVLCCWLSSAMIGAVKVAGGLANAHRYSKQGIVCVEGCYVVDCGILQSTLHITIQYTLVCKDVHVS
jgi:hypothetical protein